MILMNQPYAEYRILVVLFFADQIENNLKWNDRNLPQEHFLLTDDLKESLHFALVSYQYFSHHQFFHRHDSTLSSVLLKRNILNSIFSYPTLRWACPMCQWVKIASLVVLSLFLVPKNQNNGSKDDRLRKLTGRGTFLDSIARKSRSRKNWSMMTVPVFDWFKYLISKILVCKASKNSFTFGKLCPTPIRQLPFFSISFKW